jgi:hypothetical protein
MRVAVVLLAQVAVLPEWATVLPVQSAVMQVGVDITDVMQVHSCGSEEERNFYLIDVFLFFSMRKR